MRVSRTITKVVTILKLSIFIKWYTPRLQWNFIYDFTVSGMPVCMVCIPSYCKQIRMFMHTYTCQYFHVNWYMVTDSVTARSQKFASIYQFWFILLKSFPTMAVYLLSRFWPGTEIDQTPSFQGPDLILRLWISWSCWRGFCLALRYLRYLLYIT